MSEAFTVPCTCPEQVDGSGQVQRPAPIHDTDTVYLKDDVDPVLGTAVMQAMGTNLENTADMQAAIMGAYLVGGIASWTFQDERGNSAPINRSTTARYIRWPTSYDVADRLDDKHREVLTNPLALRRFFALSNGPTEPSTSATGATGPDQESPSSERPSLRAVSGGKRSAAKAG